MNNLKREVCRLCLKTIFENDFHAIETTIRNMLETLLLKNLGVSTKSVICKECSTDIQKFFDFKLSLLNTENKFLSINNCTENAEISLEENKNEQLIVFSKDHKLCRFCMKHAKKECFISLYETKDNIYIVDMLKKYVSELNLNDSEVLESCESCLIYLQSLVSFITNCLDTEEKIKKYIEIEGTSDELEIDLKDVQEFKFKPILMDADTHSNEVKPKENCDEQEGTVKAEVSNDDSKEIADFEYNLKMEEICIKSEETGSESFLGTTTSRSAVLKNIHKCNKCAYMTKYKSHLKNHMVIHKDQSDTMLHKCKHCLFQTKHKMSLKQHSLLHKNPSELTMYKCNMCAYETKHKGNLIKHVVIHKTASEIIMYKCDKCTFETKHRNSINDHMLIHKNHATVYQCDRCIYMTVYKRTMKKHMQHTHSSNDSVIKSGSIQMFKCNICSYETKGKRELKMHNMVRHTDTPDAVFFKCEMCPFKTKYKNSIKSHMLSHKNPSDLTMYKCDMCPYETIHKSSIRSHIHNKHKRLSEVTLHKCKLCKFETIYKSYLKQHAIIHKDSSEVTKYKCQWCLYSTRFKGGLNRHLLTHRILNPIYQNL